MISVSSAIDEIISNSPYLDEALSEGLINISALARSIMPEVERLTKKKIKESAVVMALHRRPSGHAFKVSKWLKTYISSMGDIIVRSGLSDHTFENSASLISCQRQLMKIISKENDLFCTFSQGIRETTIVASNILSDSIDKIFESEKRLTKKTGLGSITLLLPKNNTEISGVYFVILKQLAWAGINICEIISTSNEVSLIFSEQEVSKAFPILMNLKRKQ